MVDMIRGVSDGAISSGSSATTVDAKIDSAAKQVIMASPSKSAHQYVAEKTRELTARSEALGGNLHKILPDQLIFVNHRRQML